MVVSDFLLCLGSSSLLGSAESGCKAPQPWCKGEAAANREEEMAAEHLYLPGCEQWSCLGLTSFDCRQLRATGPEES